MEDKKKYINFFLIGVILIIIQTFFQDIESLKVILGGVLKSVSPFIYGLFLAMILDPVAIFFIKKLNISRNKGLFLSFVFFIAVLMGVFLIVAPSILLSVSELVKSFPGMVNKAQTLVTKFIEVNRSQFAFLEENAIKEKILNIISSQLGNIQSIIFKFGEKIVSVAFSGINILFGIIIGGYFLYYKEYFIKFIEKSFSIFLKKSSLEETMDLIFESRKIFISYLAGRAMMSVAVGVISFLIMYFTKVPYTALIAFMIGLGNMIPYLGTIVAGAVSALLVLLTLPIKLVPMFIAILVAQQMDNWILGPKVLGNSVGINPFWVITAVLIGGNIAGPIGMLMGVPVFAVLKRVYYRLLNSRHIKLCK